MHTVLQHCASWQPCHRRNPFAALGNASPSLSYLGALDRLLLINRFNIISPTPFSSIMNKHESPEDLDGHSHRMVEHSKLKKFIGVIVGEFFGTFFFLLAGFLIVLASSESTPTEPGVEINILQILAISLGFAFLVFLAITIVAPLSGGALNPAVVLCLVLTGKVNPINGASMVLTELIAGIVAAFCAKGLTASPLRFANGMSKNCTVAQGVLIEAVGTMILCLAVLFTGPNQTRSTSVTPKAIGTALLVGHLFGVYGTGAGFNPARAFGPAVADFKFPTYHWIYWVGPIVGALLASAAHVIFKFANRF